LLLKDKKQVRKSDRQTSEKNNKRRRQAEQLKKKQKEDALLEVEGTYEAGGF
jgi:hypothetical protein